MAAILELFRVLILALIGAIVSHASAPETTAPVASLAAGPAGEPGETAPQATAPASHPFVMSEGLGVLSSGAGSNATARGSETLRTRARWATESSKLVDVRSEAVEAALAAEGLDRAGRPVHAIIAEPCTQAPPTGSARVRYLRLAGVLLCALLP